MGIILLLCATDFLT